MKNVCMFVGGVVLFTFGAPVFTWLGTKFFLGYDAYVNWINTTLSAIGR